jgi:hypothetical protein
MEPVLLEFCSELRQHNGYCLSIDKTTNLAAWWRKFITGVNTGSGLPSSPPKYSALGMHRIYDLGTLEFRMFPGCKDVLKLRWYVDIIKTIYDQAMQFSVQQLLDKKIQEGVMSLLSNIILDNRKRITLDRLAECLEVGIKNANDIMRKPMNVEDIKKWHRKLFPNLVKEITLEEFLRISADSTLVESVDLREYDQDATRSFLQRYESYGLYQRLEATGVDTVAAVRNTLVLYKRLQRSV